jgi:polysaccharide biosynthesis protein PslG
MLVSNVLRAVDASVPRRPLSPIFKTVRRTAPLLACLIALAVPSGASAFQMGMQDDGAFVAAPAADRARALEYAHDMGVTYLRITLVWAAFRDDGYEPYDAAIDEARARGMDVQLTVTGNPKYTNGGRGYVGYFQPDPRRYARWIGAVARHFRGRVHWYSLWNEPNLHDFLAPQVVRHKAVGHKIYARLVAAGYRAVKAADPDAQVLIGESAPSGYPLRFIERVANALPGGLVADGFAQHAYQFLKIAPGRPQKRYTGGISNMSKMKSLLRRLAREGKLRTPDGKPLPIFLTEFGYPRPGAYYGFFSERLRADYTLRAFRFARDSGAKVLVWYQLFNHAGRPQSGLWDTGLIGSDGKPSSLYTRLVAQRASLAGF